ncbi:MAG: hypothetical protein ABF449_00565 [Ethanoligenens sp.]
MYDVSSVNRRYFDLRLICTDKNDEEHELKLQVEPPKIKLLRRLTAIAKPSGEGNFAAMDELQDVVRDMLSKNKAGYKVPDEYVDSLDFDQLVGIITAYFEWLGAQKKAKN